MTGRLCESRIRAGVRFSLPRIPSLLSTASHPAVRSLEKRHDEWLLRNYPFADTDQTRNFLAQRSVLWTAATYPTTSADRFHDLSRLTSFLFAFDDLCLHSAEDGRENTKIALADILHVMNGGAPGTRYGHALADIWSGMISRMSVTQRERLVGAVRDFGRGCLEEIKARATGTLLSPDAYLRLRLHSSLAAWVYFILTEYAAGVELDEETRSHLRPLHWTCAAHLLYANDLFSFRAEHFAGDHVNAICVALEDGDTTLQEAIDGAVSKLADLESRVFTGLRRARDAWRGARPYLEKLEYVVSGNLAQARFAPRYHKTNEFIDCPLEAGEIVLQPDRTHYSAATRDRITSGLTPDT